MPAARGPWLACACQWLASEPRLPGWRGQTLGFEPRHSVAGTFTAATATQWVSVLPLASASADCMGMCEARGREIAEGSPVNGKSECSRSGRSGCMQDHRNSLGIVDSTEGPVRP